MKNADGTRNIKPLFICLHPTSLHMKYSGGALVESGENFPPPSLSLFIIISFYPLQAKIFSVIKLIELS
jgi:hypothetical protein